MERTFQESARKLLNATDKLIKKIINNKPEIKPGQFNQELNVVLTKFKNRKATGLDDITPKVLKTRQFNNSLLSYCNTVYNQNAIERLKRTASSEKGDLWIVKNNQAMILTSIADKTFNVLLLNRIEQEIEKIVWKKPIHCISDYANPMNHWSSCEKLEATLLFVDFVKAFDSILRGKNYLMNFVQFALPRRSGKIRLF